MGSSPAFVGQFGPAVTPDKVKAALKAVGFADVVEVAIGADLCTIEEAEDFLDKVPEKQPFMATSCCPAWSVMAKKNFPDFAPYISMALTPMVLTARLIKEKHPKIEIIKSEKLLKWDELKNCIEILEKDNILLDNEIDKIIGNEFFKNYINNELRDFNTIKSKLSSLIKQNEIIITKLPKIQKDIELENLKKELKSLESKLQELVEQKTEYLNDIEEFNHEYNLHLGEIIKNILNLKKKIFFKKRGDVRDHKTAQRYDHILNPRPNQGSAVSKNGSGLLPKCDDLF